MTATLPTMIEDFGTKLAYARLRHRRIEQGLDSLLELEKQADAAGKLRSGFDKIKGLLRRAPDPHEEVRQILHPPGTNTPVALTMPREVGGLPVPDYITKAQVPDTLATPAFVRGEAPPLPASVESAPVRTKKTQSITEDPRMSLPLMHEIQHNPQAAQILGTGTGALLGAGVGAAGADEGHRLEGALGGAALGGLGGALVGPRALAKATELGQKAETGGMLQGLSERVLGLREGGGSAVSQGLLAGAAGLGAAGAGAGLLGGGISAYGHRNLNQEQG